MPPRAVLDACVLYPAALRDVLLRCAEVGLFFPRWSDRILDEMVGALSRTRPDIPPHRLQRLRALITQAFPEAVVELAPSVRIDLPDMNDAHVVATAVVCSADYLVTRNTRDFPASVLRGVMPARVVLPDEFLLMLLAEETAAVVGAVVEAARALRNPPMSAEQLLGLLATQAPGFAAAISECLERRD